MPADQSEIKNGGAEPIKTFTIPGMTAAVTIGAGDCLFVLGRNGAGKSALMHYLNIVSRPEAVYLPGSRPSSFSNDGLTMNALGRAIYEQHSQHWDSLPASRYRSFDSGQRIEKPVYDLIAKETQYAHEAVNSIKAYGPDSEVIEQLKRRESPLDRANQLLEQSNLAIRLKFVNGELVTSQDQSPPYNIIKMSDGERISILMIAEILTAPPRSIFLIDEPERHLHRSISVPLLIAIMAERPDCAFVIATHDLSLPEEVTNGQVILVRSCIWAGESVESWEMDFISSISSIPEALRIDILGSRRRILFVEGEQNSLDQPLYAVLYPGISIRAKSNCREVRKAVTGLRSIEAFHRVDVFGLVDNDSQDESTIAALADEGIFALPDYSVESLYYSGEVLEAVARRQAETLGITVDSLLEQARDQALSGIQPHEIVSLASLVSGQLIHREVVSAIPSPHDLVDELRTELTITVPTTFPSQKIQLEQLIRDQNISEIIRRYPVRQSGILHRLATGLHFRNLADYQRAALTQIAADPATAEALRARLGAVTAALLA